MAPREAIQKYAPTATTLLTGAAAVLWPLVSPKIPDSLQWYVIGGFVVVVVALGAVLWARHWASQQELSLYDAGRQLYERHINSASGHMARNQESDPVHWFCRFIVINTTVTGTRPPSTKKELVGNNLSEFIGEPGEPLRAYDNTGRYEWADLTVSRKNFNAMKRKMLQIHLGGNL